MAFLGPILIYQPFMDWQPTCPNLEILFSA